MVVRQTLTGIVVLATSIGVFAQTTDTKPPAVNSNVVPSSQPSVTLLNPCGSGSRAMLPPAEILTDTMGADFGPYLTRIVPMVKQNWYAFLPPSVYPPILKQGKTVLEFQIRKDGSVTGMIRDNSSGDTALDRAAWMSITSSTPFPPLPTEFRGQSVGLRFYYFYNTEPIRISISPCVDVRVPAGSTLQFSASGKGITNTSVKWSVSGPGCLKSDCGTISDTGLYTAPADVPIPPTVIVEATSRSEQTDVGARGESKLVVVQANPPH
jgi:TonB family protein